MRDWVEPFRPVCQRTVRSETTKDKAGTLPPTAYVKERGYQCIYLEREHHTQPWIDASGISRIGRVRFQAHSWPVFTCKPAAVFGNVLK